MQRNDGELSTQSLDKSKRLRPATSLYSSSFGIQEGDSNVHDDDLDVKISKKGCLLDLFCRSGLAKVPAFLEHLQQFLDDPLSGKVDKLIRKFYFSYILMFAVLLKVLVFAHHRAVLDEVVAFLSTKAVNHIRIDGQTASKERHSRVNSFQNNPSCRVAVLAITAAGVAISLTAAATVFFVELFCA